MSTRQVIDTAPQAPGAAAAGPGRLAPVVYAVALAWFVFSWNLRTSVLMAWSPVEPIHVGAVALGLCVAHRLSRPLPSLRAVMVPALVVVAALLPGAYLSAGDGYAPVKTALLLGSTVPAFLAAVLLLDTARARWCWVWAQVLTGSAVAVASVRYADDGSIAAAGRVALRSVDTITTARLVGVAIVVLAVVVVSGPMGARLVAVLWAAGASVVLVSVGSRGPVLALLLTLISVLLVSRRFSGRRLRAVAWAALVAAGLYVLVRSTAGVGAARIASAFESPFEDEARRALISDGLSAGWNAPLGTGWGSFPTLSVYGASLANAEGNAYPHNVFAELFVEGGLVALLGFTAAVVLALWRLVQNSGDYRGMAVLASSVYWLVNAQVSGDLNSNRVMWVAIAVGLAATAATRVRPRTSAGLRAD